MRSFNEKEIRNQQFLVDKRIKFTLVQITATGIKKSILDATIPMRAYFLENNIHDYSKQAQGQNHSHIVRTHILTLEKDCVTKTSMYRPVTKKGDPRLWVYQLTKYTNADDIHAIIANDNSLYVINITQVDIEACYNSLALHNNPITDFIDSLYHKNNSVAEELLQKFQTDSGIWHESEITADTGIGRTIESLLGISMNSSKLADYKGIELKSRREKRTVTKNGLFTQTPDWNISKLKSGLEIANKYGYEAKPGWKTLQNTLTCESPNSQGLQLNIDNVNSLLGMFYNKDSKSEDVAAWQLVKLHERLATKHHETFWIEVKNKFIDNKEYFCYSYIEHTKNPIISQFDVLLEQSMITLDLMLHRPSGNGDTYSFKIKKKAMPLLFPQSTIYDLLDKDLTTMIIASDEKRKVAQEYTIDFDYENLE